MDCSTVRRRSFLEDCPRDLMMKIVEYAPESVYELRLSCQEIKSSVDSYAVRKGTVKLVEELTISCSASCLAISATVPKSKSDLFELCLKPRLSYLGFKGRSMILSACIGETSRHYAFKTNDAYGSERQIEHLRSCMVKRVSVVSINESTDFRAIFKLLKQIAFDKLHVRYVVLRDNVDQDLLELLSQSSVKQLSLRIGVLHRPSFLLDCAAIVRAISIEQINVNSGDSAYFVGIPEDDRATIIQNMFSGAMSKMRIINAHYPEYVSSQCVQALTQQLPQLNKQLWFEASNTYTFNMLGVSQKPGYSIKTDDNVLQIKHYYRENETFEEINKIWQQ